MLSSLQDSIRKHALFRAGERVGVAVSGGADSVALLRGLLQLRGELGIVLSVVHVHHGIRGAEADADEQFVQHLAKRFDLPLNTKRVDVPAHRKRERLSVEVAARELRYGFFKCLLEAGTCDKIATAHTLDDQAETVLLRILRGTGTRGLAAIPPFRNASPELAARIVRPLLATRREEIEHYLQSLDQPWCEDASNRDPQHLRNRIRHQLLPELEGEFNPAVRHALANLAEIARGEESYWASQLAPLASFLAETEHGITLERAPFIAAPLALQRRLLVEIADRLDLPVGFNDIELMLHVAAEAGRKHELEGGWTVNSTTREFEIRKAAETEAADYSFDLSVPGIVTLPNGVSVRAIVVEDAADPRFSPGTLLAYDRLQFPLRVRNWQPGDRLWLLGSKQSEKLKRLFSKRRIAAEERTEWPVVVSSEQIVWVRGFPVASEFAAKSGKAVLIEIA